MIDGDLIGAIAATGKPIIMSVRPTDRVTILEATDYEGRLTLLGLSDHSPEGRFVDVHGRPMIERHLMLADVPNEDSAFSSTPEGFADYVRSIKS
jgi:sialic acid synthase SpsE